MGAMGETWHGHGGDDYEEVREAGGTDAAAAVRQSSGAAADSVLY